LFALATGWSNGKKNSRYSRRDVQPTAHQEMRILLPQPLGKKWVQRRSRYR